MLGIKIRKITTNNTYTIDSLYEAIKDKKFTAGTPAVAKHAFIKLIVFPALDRRNQVQIQSLGKNKFQVQKAEEAGVGNSFKNSMQNSVTGGFAAMKGIVGDNAKRCEELVEITANELEALGL